MSQSIGEVNISLRMSLASFKQDVANGTKAASDSSKRIASEFKSSSQEAKASLALIGDEIGVSIPRHIRGFIAAIPGVGSALTAAFNSVALIAFIGVLGEVVKKIVELRAFADELKSKHAEAFATIEKAANKLELEYVDLQLQTRQLQTGHIDLAAAFERTQHAIADELLPSLEKFNKDTQKNIEDQIGLKSELAEVATFILGHGRLFDTVNGKVRASIEANQAFRESLQGLSASDALQKVTERLNTMYALVKTQGGAAQKVTKGEIESLEGLQKLFSSGTNKEWAEGQKQAAEETKRLAEEAKKAKEDLKKLEEEQLRILDGVDKLTLRRKSFGLPLPTGDNEQGTFQLGQTLEKLPQPQLPVFSGTKEAQELTKIQDDQNEAIKQAQSVYTLTRTRAEQYANEVEVLNELLKQGKIDQDTYSRAVFEAKNKFDDISKSTQELGTHIADTIRQGSLLGSSWKQVLESMAVEVGQLILKMTLLKGVTQQSLGGGFLGSLAGGLLNLPFKAAGGPVGQGNSYIVGENGPEVFTPNTSGRIIPNNQLKSGGNSPDKTVVQNFVQHVHGVTDADSFRKSSANIAAEALAMMATAHKRNNG